MIPHRFTPEPASQELVEAVAGMVVDLPSEIERRQSILVRDIEHQEGRERQALATLKGELATIKLARQELRERETAARQAYSALVETTDTLARASRAALKEMGE